MFSRSNLEKLYKTPKYPKNTYITTENWNAEVFINFSLFHATENHPHWKKGQKMTDIF